MNFKIISGYTKNTPYEQEITNLTESLHKYNITNYEIVGYNNFGNWNLNCQYKAQIILEQLQKYNVPIVWLDADAVLYDYPLLFNNINEDISFCDYYGDVATCTLYMKPTAQIISLCHEWISLNTRTGKNAILGDQKNLTSLVMNKHKIPYFNLPVSYAKIDFAKCSEKVIIGQNQASRRFKNTINKTHKPIQQITNKSIEYASHLKLLTKYLMLIDNNSTVVETGCGFFSSPVISSIAEYKNLKYYIYYNNNEYKTEISKFVKNATFIYVHDWSKWTPEIEASLYFHDNEELIVNRYKQINKILPKTQYLMLHDYSTYLKRNCDMSGNYIIEETKELNPTTCVIKGLI
jgi:hypothetical protein